MRLLQEQWETIIRHCRAGAPHEACGILAGSGDMVTAVHCLENARHSPVEYDLTPRGYLLVAELDDAGQVLAVFHSHPLGEAYPSQTDRQQAFWPVRYMIVSLAGKQPVVRAFRLRKSDRWAANELAEVVEEEVEIV
jgi:[CysO sulfur-carrier protein]-S-L-cysteine hydrolase